jgi:phosphohistidine phosphatase
MRFMQCPAMLRLALLRHAKSSWDHPGLDDFERPLNARGKDAAPMMGQLLASMNFSPDAVLCSPAQRTRETLACIEPSFKDSPHSTTFHGGLYLAGASDILARIREVAAPAKSLLVIGHNPGLHALATHMASSGDAAQMARLEDRFPTAALALFSFDAAAWSDVKVKTGHLEAFITPKDRT